MELHHQGSQISLHGPVSQPADYDRLKEVLEEKLLEDHTALQIMIHDSKVITSSVLGILLKMVHMDNVAIRLQIAQPSLYRMLNSTRLCDPLQLERL